MSPFFRSLLVLNGLLLLAAPAFSQTGKLFLSVGPKNAQVRIDGQVLDPADGRTVELAPGSYDLEIWAPYFKLQTERVIVRAGETTTYTRGLIQKSSEYAPFLAAKSAYATKKLKRTITDVSLAAACATVGYVLFGQKVVEAKRVYDRALEVRELHYESVSPALVNDYEIAYARLTEEYDAAKSARDKQLAVGIPVMTLVTGALAYHLIRRAGNRPVRPVFLGESPFRESIGFLPRFHFSGTTPCVGLAMTF